MNEIERKAYDRVVQARSTLLLEKPFFGVLSIKLKLIPDPSCDTMWTDGRSLGFNPKWVLERTPAELQGIICHEDLHVSNGHTWRRRHRNPGTWNEACDYAINPIVLGDGLKLPEGPRVDARFDGMSAEQIYELLNLQRCSDSRPEPRGGSGGHGGGAGESGTPGEPGEPDGSPSEPSGGSEPDGHGEAHTPVAGEVRDWPDPDTEAEHEGEWRVAVSQAAKFAKGRGLLPASLERLVQEAVRPRTDWRSILRRFVQQVARSDYTWKRPNRRYAHAGLYLPSLHSEGLGPIVVAIDTSGSIDDRTLAAFSAEIGAIAEECKPEEIVAVYVDAAVQAHQRFAPGEPIELTPKGGGGTAFAPAFDWVDEEGISPVCLIYLTDLMGSFPNRSPEYPVLWAATTAEEAPFGETVRIDLD